MLVQSHSSGLPLSGDIEGPSSIDVDFLVGARPITSGTDNNFVGWLAGLVIMPHEPPAAFSRCVLQCLETIAADTAGTNVIADTFNQQDRQLTLYGPESPDVFQSVLRTVIYTNLAPDINVAWIRVEVFDGINSTTEVVQVLQGVPEMRKRRDVRMTEPDRRHSHPLYVTENESEKPNKEKAVKTSSVGLYWPIAIVAVSSIGILLAIVIVWGVRRKQLPNSLA